MITQFSKNQSPTFGYRFPQRAVSDIRLIPHLTCAKCGEEMLTMADRKKFLNSLRATASNAVKRPEFQIFKGTEEFSFLVRLAKKFPHITFAESIKEPKTSRTLSRMPKDKSDKIMHLVRLTNCFSRKSPQVAKKLNSLKPIMPKTYAEMTDVMEIFAKRYPKLTFSEIFRKPDIFNYYNNIMAIRKAQNAEASTKVWDKINQMLKNEPPEIINEFESLKAQAPSFNRATGQEHKLYIRTLFIPLLEKINNARLRTNISKELENLPTENFGIENLIVKAGQKEYNDMDFLDAILTDLTNTFDHIIPDSEGGSGCNGNGLFMHRYCNVIRGTLHYDKLQEVFPDFGSYIQKQINKIIAFIKAGKLKGAAYYPYNVKKTLNTCSQNKINVNIKNFLTFKKKRLGNAITSLESLRANHLEQFNKAKKTVEDTEKEIIRLQHLAREQRENKNLFYTRLQTDNKQINIIKKKYNNIIEELEKKKK